MGKRAGRWAEHDPLAGPPRVLTSSGAARAAMPARPASIEANAPLEMQVAARRGTFAVATITPCSARPFSQVPQLVSCMGTEVRSALHE